MAKHTVLLASFIALLFLVDASIYKTTIIVDDEGANQSFQTCREQLRVQQNLWPCQDYISRQVTGLGVRHGYSKSLGDCCNRLEGLRSQCRCDGLKMAVDEQRTRGQILAQDSRKAYGLAQQLPEICGVGPRECQFGPQ